MTQEDYDIVKELLFYKGQHQLLSNIITDLGIRIKERKWYPLTNPLLGANPDVELITNEVKKIIEELNNTTLTTENSSNSL
ncbi:hypothetical protein [Capnocytophaga canis]|uniref:hypothetical protein n=1 Tax=Capnocytophaga canis TaxID=1848903 RepID=UPI00156286A7|nr:hypothetical protein [Capnocytophaga canis]